MHEQAMIHGDLKGVRLSTLVPALPPNVLSCQGEYPDRPKWPRTSGGLRTTHHHLGSHEFHALKFCRGMRYDTMDESGAS